MPAPGDSLNLCQVQCTPAVNSSLAFLDIEEQAGQQRRHNQVVTRKGGVGQQEEASKVEKQK